MANSFKTQMLKKEFLEKGELQLYVDVLDSLIDRIILSDCRISACENSESSLIEQSLEVGVKNHIRISFKEKRDRPIHVLWDILHEFGHHLSGHPNNCEKTVEREKEAWDLGLEILKEFPMLKKEDQDYYQYQEKKLAYYRNYNNNLKPKSI